ncbi:MAG: acetyl-CoA acetyltransferase [Acidiferrobacteraceae bacterium]|nr:acetyl-CoA acetyltransferase [Acidiferrobacteraceae bacterium]MDP6434924.1 thiolase family protein [Arenicellales bacterium]MDP6673151.1 thiolase family protein [Arenicellales bacterium]MDP6724760.1 thiolase family protein [Arenicellales bacterium]
MGFRAEIPYGAYWSTPFCKWQGSLSGLHSIQFAAHVAVDELKKRDLPGSLFDYGVLGFSVPQKHSFYGLPWFMGMVGAGDVGGPTIAQACATSVRTLLAGAQEIESGLASNVLLTTCDRTSNGPHLYYPNPGGPGGTGAHEDWVMDNFSCDPLGRHSMIQTAENVAARHGVTTEAQHEVVIRRTEQYQMATADDHAFQKKYITLPFEVPAPNFRKTRGELSGDEGITLSTAEGLSRLKPVLPDGSVTFGGQTFPADGNASMILTTADKAGELSQDPSIRIRLLGFGLSRTELAFMPEATIPAAKQALEMANLKITQIDAIKSHNPFAINDIVFAKETGADLMSMNNYGCSLIWGHPQGPTGLRSIIELIEELVIRGGGAGLFQGCAAGDTAMAVVLQVEIG